MTRIISTIAACLLMATLTQDSQADGTDRFARRLNRHPVLHHSPFARGPEVVYRSSGRAALLPQVTRIVCRGRVCVGR
jgi:hypothetical protein